MKGKEEEVELVKGERGLERKGGKRKRERERWKDGKRK